MSAQKSVGIITLHFYENFGSVLQAYALKKTVEKLTGYNTEIIPFKPNLPDYRYFQHPELHRQFLDKKAGFDDFRHKFCGISGEISENQLKNLNYDYYITGSDQIWNPEITKLNGAYFLDFVKNKPKIAYAASMALDISSTLISAEIFSRLIPGLDYVSMRESSHVPFVQQFTKTNVLSVLDPTMLLHSDDYRVLAQNNRVKREPYLLSYFLTHNAAVVDFTTALAKKFNLKVVHYFADYPIRVFPENSECFAFAEPREFLALMEGASMIFTNSFHGTVFAILFNRPFYTFMAKRKMLSRALDLTDLFKLSERRFYDFSDIKKATLDMEYSGIMKRLGEERKKSEQFLQAALTGDAYVQ